MGLRGFDLRTRSRMGGSPSFLCFSLCFSLLYLCFSLLYLCSSLLLSRSSLLLPCLTPHTSHTLPVGLVGMLREVGGSPIRSWHLERRPPKGFGARSDKLTPTTLRCDNTSAINIAKDDVYHARTKHIDIYYHWIREQVAKRSIHVEFVSTHDNIADIMTKALPEPKVNLFVDAMRLRA